MNKNQWIKLDNAAKIFPPTVRGSNSQVFRLSCELDLAIDPDILQQALRETISVFPIYQYVMRKGLFWYYLEGTAQMPRVREEYKHPCAQLNVKSSKSLLYEVTYYRNRVNLELFHVITDGMGASLFMCTLMTKYLSRIQGIEEPTLAYHASYTQMSNDSFLKYYDNKSGVTSQKQPDSCKIKDARHPEDKLRVITGSFPVDDIRNLAKEYKTTITVLLCACLMNAIGSTLSLRAKRKPVVVAVPVNLRTIFPSLSARNFFSIANVSYNYSTGSGELETVIRKVQGDLAAGLEPGELNKTLNRYSAMEHNPFARIVPLPLKNFAMHWAYWLSRRKVTATLSNIGVISVPDELSHIRSFDIAAGTDSLQACVCSFKNRLSVGFSSPFVSTDIQQHFFRTLSERGIEIEITSNNIDDE